MSSVFRKNGEEWPIYDLGESEHAHAVGVLTLNYNDLEWVMLRFHLCYTGSTQSVTRFVFEKLNNDARIELLRRAVRHSSVDSLVRQHLEHFIKGYNICTQNRNLLNHTQLVIRAAEKDPFIGVKRTRRATAPIVYNFDLELVRTVADEIFKWFAFGSDLLTYVIDTPRLKKQTSRTGSLPKSWPSLPEKPELPNDRTSNIQNSS